MTIPPGYLRWAATGAGVVAAAALIATAVSMSGLFGSSPEDSGRTVRASVVTGAPCDRPGATEKVRFTVSGKSHEARFDGCGHAKDERVEVRVPSGPVRAGLVVHAAGAAVGDRDRGADLGLLLIVVSGVAGAGYALLVRPRLPRVLRLARA